MIGQAMELPETFTEPTWTPRQRAILQWLSGNSALSLSELYEGALHLMARKVPGRVRLVAHVVREIRNRLPDALSPRQGQRAKHLDYHGVCREIRARWRRIDPLQDEPRPGVPSASGMVMVPASAAELIDQLLADDVAVEGKARDGATRLFAAAVRVRSNRELTNAELVTIEPAIRQWREVTEWFMRKTHDNGIPDGETDSKEFQQHFDLFEYALNSLIRDFYPAMKEIDDILEDANC